MIYRVLARTYLSALHSHNAAVQSARLSSDSVTLRFFQNLFTQDLNTFNREKYAKNPTENGLRMRHLAPKIGRFSQTPTPYGRRHLLRILPTLASDQCNGDVGFTDLQFPHAATLLFFLAKRTLYIVFVLCLYTFCQSFYIYHYVGRSAKQDMHKVNKPDLRI